jgi:hypothetical protein
VRDLALCLAAAAVGWWCALDAVEWRDALGGLAALAALSLGL